MRTLSQAVDARLRVYGKPERFYIFRGVLGDRWCLKDYETGESHYFPTWREAMGYATSGGAR